MGLADARPSSTARRAGDLIFGVEEAVKEAQKGGSGVVIYFRKEGRALGEVTKYLVYNARKRGEDRASEYFKRTENIAGVKDMRFQALMPDVSSQLRHSRLNAAGKGRTWYLSIQLLTVTPP